MTVLQFPNRPPEDAVCRDCWDAGMVVPATHERPLGRTIVFDEGVAFEGTEWVCEDHVRQTGRGDAALP